MVDIKKHLVPKIRARFGDRPIEDARGTEYIAIFHCIHSEFGDIYVSDEREEITIVGNFTHVHFDDRGWPEPEFQYESEDDYAEKISEEAVDYLKRSSLTRSRSGAKQRASEGQRLRDRSPDSSAGCSSGSSVTSGQGLSMTDLPGKDPPPAPV
jgi:hypothetical protein